MILQKVSNYRRTISKHKEAKYDNMPYLRPHLWNQGGGRGNRNMKINLINKLNSKEILYSISAALLITSLCGRTLV